MNYTELFEHSKTVKDVEVVVDNNSLSKGALMKAAYNGNTSGVDSAIPMSIWDKMNDYGGTFWFVMDYQTQSFGKLIHLGEKILGLDTNWDEKFR